MQVVRIMVVDGEQGIRRFVRYTMEPLGYVVVEARHLDEAFSLAGLNSPDIILVGGAPLFLDTMDLCRRLREDPRTGAAPLILMSHPELLPDRDLTLQTYVDEVLCFDFTAAELAFRVRTLLKLRQAREDLEGAVRSLQDLALTAEGMDPSAREHGISVRDLAVQIVGEFGLPEPERRAVEAAAVLHDIGKAFVPDSILRKPGPLTPEEAGIVRLHPIHGARVCSPYPVLRDVIPLIRGHHERLDGSGYPDGLKGGEIPMTLRVLSVADAYDALRAPRPHREPFAPGRCLEILREEVARGWWDGQIVEALTRVVERSGALLTAP